jgi:cytochrome c oxidase subunit IV
LAFCRYRLDISIHATLSRRATLMNINSSPGRIHILTGAALLGLLALTIAVPYLDLGALNPVVASAISVTSAALILLFYMHVHQSKPLLWVFVGAGFFWLGIMFVLAPTDFMTWGVEMRKFGVWGSAVTLHEIRRRIAWI